MRSLEEILAELDMAEKEYADKCKKYGIEEKRKKKKSEVILDENGNVIAPELDENSNSVDEEASNNYQSQISEIQEKI